MAVTPSRSTTVLAAVLRLLRPVVRLLLRHGVAYPAFAAALKQVFLDAARDELRHTGQKQTDSAVSLLSGVHRRDVRTLGHGAPAEAPPDEEPLSLASQVVARWLGDVAYLDDEGSPRELPRYGDAPSFDALVSEVSRDIRPRAVLAELERLGMAEHVDRRVRLLAPGFVPRQGFAEMVALLRDNTHDHLAAATLNLDGQHNYLEQSVFVDELTAESAAHLHAAAAKAWRQAFRTVMREAQARFDHDQAHASAAQRVYRARFGSYFYAADQDDKPV
ncbi:MAG: DUF6502 family protein [Proteobacteria bacterium]|jgi:hypothetical protein|nr:hypothetical protein [Ramlibacter sp.]MCA0215685.1 DUF6502 family protein [Pseudomonadota bacterium]